MKRKITRNEREYDLLYVECGECFCHARIRRPPSFPLGEDCAIPLGQRKSLLKNRCNETGVAVYVIPNCQNGDTSVCHSEREQLGSRGHISYLVDR